MCIKIACNSQSCWTIPLSEKKYGHLKPTHIYSTKRTFLVCWLFFKQCYFSVCCLRCIFLPLSGLLLLWMNSKGENCISFLSCSFCKNYLMLAASGIKSAGLEGCKGISEFYGNVQSSTGNLCNAAVILTIEQKNFWELDVFLPGVLVGDGCEETHL